MARRSSEDLLARAGAAPFVKAHLITPPASDATPEIAAKLERRPLESNTTLTPPYDPKRCIEIWEDSALLPPNVAAYATNIDSFGHRFVPAIDLYAPDADFRIREQMWLEREQAGRGDRNGRNGQSPQAPTDEEVAARKEALRSLARREHAQMQAFFNFCAPKTSFAGLRRQIRVDMEVTGNAYVEVVRAGSGKIARLHLAPVATMRLGRLDPEAVEADEKIQVSDLEWETIKQPRTFRRFAQIDPDSRQVVCWFREFGDPRVVSRKSGRAYKSTEALFEKEGPGALSATEILHFAVYHPGTPYGVPRWIGALLAVLGSREADSANHDYWKSNAVPPLAILVSGGRIRQDVVPTLEKFFDTRVKGRGSHAKVVIIEAESSRAGAHPGIVPQVQFKSLREMQRDDAMFLDYDERNEDKVASAFRLPRILTGRDRALNRATAEAAIEFAESQVFAAERADFDAVVNRLILPELDVTFWRYESNAPVTHDPVTLSDVVTRLVRYGVLSINEARSLASHLFNRDYAPWGESWANQPLPLVLAEAKAHELSAALLGAPADLPEGETETRDTPRGVSLTGTAPAAPAVPTARSRRGRGRGRAGGREDRVAAVHAHQPHEPDSGEPA